VSRSHIPAALRRLVRERARQRCEYCLYPEAYSFAPHEVDHIIAEKHSGATQEANLALACVLCNGFKGSDLSSIDPITGELVALFHPREHRWENHFSMEEGVILPLTSTGRVTVRLRQLNQGERVQERQTLLLAGELIVPG
jgi:hypothetical protein